MTNPIDRLRANLRAVGIAATSADIAGIEAKGFLSRLPDVERMLDATPGETLPDYLDAAALPLSTASESQGALPIDGPPDTLLGAAARLRARTVSPVELVEQSLSQIAARDPQLNAFQLRLADQARATAAQAEAEIAAGNYRGPLHGVPVAVKDLLDLEGTITTAGTKILAENMAATDATAVAQLRAAGAIIVGKTRMSEFAYSPGSNNAHYGPTANPYNPAHDSGGSSSGSAVAVASGLVYAALGSDTGGSIRIPAALCGIVGLKPTHGRTSLAGAVTLSWSLDHLGPLTRSVADAAVLLEILSGPDPRDTRTLRPAPQYRAGGLDQGLHGLRVGLLGDDGTAQPLASAEILEAVRRGAETLREAGADLIELDILEIEQLRLLNPAILAMEASALHMANLRARLDDYGEFMRQRVLAAFIYGPGDFVRAQQARAVLRRRMARIFEQIDLLVLPCQPAVAPALGTPAPTTFTGPFNCLGWPAISLPAGMGTAGLPLALQIVARPWEEPLLLRAAHHAEQALGRLAAA